MKAAVKAERPPAEIAECEGKSCSHCVYRLERLPTQLRAVDEEGATRKVDIAGSALSPVLPLCMPCRESRTALSGI